MPTLSSSTWIRTGQTAQHRLTRERVQVVGVTDRVETRVWHTTHDTSELGERRSFTLGEFGSEWFPYYNSMQTCQSSKFAYIPTMCIYEVLGDTPRIYAEVPRDPTRVGAKAGRGRPNPLVVCRASYRLAPLFRADQLYSNPAKANHAVSTPKSF